jgi:hypothetical protein
MECEARAAGARVVVAIDGNAVYGGKQLRIKNIVRGTKRADDAPIYQANAVAPKQY